MSAAFAWITHGQLCGMSHLLDARPHIIIRKEEACDLPDVSQVNATAFQRPDEAELVNALRTNPAAFVADLSLVAEVDGTIVGHILFTRCWIEDGSGNSVESLALAPMAVLPELQRKGIGDRLVRSGLERARNLGSRSVIVLGHAHYYPRFGFTQADAWNIRAPLDVPADHYMAIELVPGALATVSGIVRYAPEFGIG